MQKWLPNALAGLALALSLGAFIMLTLAVSYLKDIRDGSCRASRGQPYEAAWRPHIERVRLR